MRSSACLGLGVALAMLPPAAAFAGGHAPAAPAIVRPAVAAPVASRHRVIDFVKPAYGPPSHAIYGPPQNSVRRVWRQRGQGFGYAGYPFVYQPGGEQAPVQVQAAPSGEPLRPRANVVYNYAGGPPLWQGDAGYVAQPVIYNVQTVLRRYPLTGAEPRVVK